MKTKRLLSIALCLVMALSALAPLSSYAADPAPDVPQYSVGDTLKFGSYPQSIVTDAALIAALDALTPAADGDLELDGAKYRYAAGTDGRGMAYYRYEPIVWRVLEQDGGELFVLADKILKAGMNFEDIKDSQNWEFSQIRAWLNDTFIADAFTQRECAAVAVSTLTTYQYDSSEVLCTTQDKVFLLSREEVTSPAYGFAENSDRIAVTTGYGANASGIYEIGRAWYWWLRSPGRSGCMHAVYPSGTVSRAGVGVSGDQCLRPALRLNLTSSFFADMPQYSVGDTIKFGSYPQSIVTDAALIAELNALTPDVDGDLELNGVKYRYAVGTEGSGMAYYRYEPIVWRVLEQDGGELFVLADKILKEGMTFEDIEDSQNWESSQIRAWLNDTFIADAFTQRECAAVAVSTLTTYQYDSSEVLCTTRDKAFLLSREEATNPAYDLAEYSDRIAVTTGYGSSVRGIYEIGQAWYWWLRSPGDIDRIYAVYSSGVVGGTGASNRCGLRPALRLNLTSPIFADMPQYSVGDTLEFGSYPQPKVTDSALIAELGALTPDVDGDLELDGAKYRKGTGANDSGTAYYRYEPIVWRVLEQDDGELFVLADKILTAGVPFDDDSNNWESSDIRGRLNSTFLGDAFTSEENAAVMTSKVETYKRNSSELLCTTYDKVFLPSTEEVRNPATALSPTRTG